MVAARHTRLTRRRVLLIFVAVGSALVAILLWARRQSPQFAPVTTNSNHEEPATGSVSERPPAPTGSLSPATETGSSATAAASASALLTQTPAPPGAAASPSVASNQPASNIGLRNGSFVGTLKLIVPVVGIRPEQLSDTFTDARAEGRVHDAIDIPAPAGTPVVAAADGEIIKLFQSERGGTTIYQLSPDKKLVFYYAHLQRYADGLVEGKFVKQGEVIAYVGDTGNAGAGNFHLHFSISIVSDPRRYWEGTNINPYPLLRK